MEAATALKFDELDPAVQRRVLDRHCYDEVQHYDWWEHVYNDAVAAATALGIQVDSKNGNQTPSIWFELHMQGAGASFDGRVYPYELEGAAARVRAFTDSDEELHRLGDEADAIWVAVKARMLTLKLKEIDFDPADARTHFVIRSGIPSHDASIHESYIGSEEVIFEGDIMARLQQLVKDFAGWIYNQLEMENNYLTSDDAIKERLQDQQFDEDGNVL